MKNREPPGWPAHVEMAERGNVVACECMLQVLAAALERGAPPPPPVAAWAAAALRQWLEPRVTSEVPSGAGFARYWAACADAEALLDSLPELEAKATEQGEPVAWRLAEIEAAFFTLNIETDREGPTLDESFGVKRKTGRPAASFKARAHQALAEAFARFRAAANAQADERGEKRPSKSGLVGPFADRHATGEKLVFQVLKKYPRAGAKQKNYGP